MTSVVDKSVSPQRSHAFLLGVFGLLALALAAVGCYGVVAYSVAQRTSEIGIRMALGAQRFDILCVAASGTITSALAGLGLGATGALGLTRLMSSLLFGVAPTDPVTFFAAFFVVLATASLACYIPARRAMRVDPMVALRHE